MKIPGNDPLAFLETRLLGTRPTADSNAPRRTTGEGDAAGDRIAISQRARALQQVSQAVAQTPPVRSERVAELAARIEAGQYRVDDAETARRLVRSALIDSLL